MQHIDGELEARQHGETGRQSAHVAGAGGVERETGEKAFEVENAVEGAADFLALKQIGVEFGHGSVAGFEGVGIDERTQDGRAQQAFAHGRLTVIEGVEERNAGVLANKQRLDQFEVAHGDLVELESGGMLLEFEAVDVQGFDLLRGSDVVENCAGSDGGGGMGGEAVAFEGADVELALDQGDGEVAGPHPIVEARAGGNAVKAAFQLGGQLGAGGKEEFAGGGFDDFVDGLLAGGWAGKLGGAEFAGGDVEQGDCADGLFGGAGFEERGEKVVLLLAEGVVEGGAGGEDAGDFAADDLLGELGVLHLVADGNAVALAQELGQVAIDGVVGDAAHGLRALAIARRQGELQFAADGDGVVVEELIEVAHAEEEQGVGILALGRGPLAHEGCQVGEGLL